MMPLAIEVLALKILISTLGLPISYLYYIVGEKQFTTIKFKNCEGAWHQVTNPGALREIKMSVVAAAEAYGADVYTQSGTLATCLLLQLR